MVEISVKIKVDNKTTKAEISQELKELIKAIQELLKADS